MKKRSCWLTNSTEHGYTHAPAVLSWELVARDMYEFPAMFCMDQDSLSDWHIITDYTTNKLLEVSLDWK